MSEQPDNERGLDLRTRVTIRAWEDPEFRQLVRTNPKAAIESMGESVPENFIFNIVNDVAGAYNLVLMEPPSGTPSTVTSEDLSERDAARASQGRSCTLTAECFCPRSLTGACGLFC